MKLRDLFRREPEVKAQTSPLRTVNAGPQPPSVSELDQTQPHDEIIRLVEARTPPLDFDSLARWSRTQANIPDEKVIGIGCCQDCGAELIVTCPASDKHSGVVISNAAPTEPKKDTRTTSKFRAPVPTLLCRCGATVPRNPKGGRAPKFPRCIDCKKKEGLAA